MPTDGRKCLRDQILFSSWANTTALTRLIWSRDCHLPWKCHTCTKKMIGEVCLFVYLFTPFQSVSRFMLLFLSLQWEEKKHSHTQFIRLSSTDRLRFYSLSTFFLLSSLFFQAWEPKSVLSAGWDIGTKKASFCFSSSKQFLANLFLLFPSK